jgi:hypothetical protein
VKKMVSVAFEIKQYTEGSWCPNLSKHKGQRTWPFLAGVDAAVRMVISSFEGATADEWTAKELMTCAFVAMMADLMLDVWGWCGMMWAWSTMQLELDVSRVREE